MLRALDDAGIDALDVTRREVTLDDVFLTLTGAKPVLDEPEELEPAIAGGQTMSKSLIADAAVLGRRNLEHIRQVPEKLTNVTIQPLMFVLLFAYVFGGAIHVEGGTYQEFLMGGILIQTLAFAMMGPAQTVAQDFQQGAIDRFRSLPIARPAYLLGHYFAEMLGSILTIAILLGTGLIVGWRTHSGFLEIIEGGAAAARVRDGDRVDRHLARDLRAVTRRGDGHRVRDHLPAHVHLERVRADLLDAEGAAVVRGDQPRERADLGDP